MVQNSIMTDINTQSDEINVWVSLRVEILGDDEDSGAAGRYCEGHVASDVLLPTSFVIHY